MRVLELFSGTGSVGQTIRRIYKKEAVTIVSLDIHPKYNPTLAVDILKWDYTVYPPGHFDLVWASPPCTEYSVAKSTGVRRLTEADRIVKRTLHIIEYFHPKWWFIENPGGGGLLQNRPFMRPLETLKNRCTYCHYGKGFRKSTNIWSNVPNLRLRHCSGTDVCAHKRLYGRHAQTAQQGNSPIAMGSKTSKKSYPIPHKLVRHIITRIVR